MAWLCPECKKLQHFAYRCKFCGYKNKKKITAEKLMSMRKYKIPNSDDYWIRKRRDEKSQQTIKGNT